MQEHVLFNSPKEDAQYLVPVRLAESFVFTQYSTERLELASVVIRNGTVVKNRYGSNAPETEDINQ